MIVTQLLIVTIAALVLVGAVYLVAVSTMADLTAVMGG